MNGGPSPRMRALASQDKLTRRNSAASFGVSKRSTAAILAVGIVIASPEQTRGLTLISNVKDYGRMKFGKIRTF
jgi:hypothetical protein